MTNILAPLRGANFREPEEKDAVSALSVGDPLTLEREPTNQYDENAIMILNADGTLHLGYVGREFAEDIAPLMDAGHTVECKVDHFAGALAPVVMIEVSEVPAEVG